MPSTMSAVNVTDVKVIENPSMFCDPFQFEISYESFSSLTDDLEWKLIYVGCAEDDRYDQVLETVLVGPVAVGNFKFCFQVDPPQVQWIPEDEILGITAIILTCSYRNREFFRVGYYVSNQYIYPELIENPPDSVVVQNVQRFVVTSVPRISKSPLSFSDLFLHSEMDSDDLSVDGEKYEFEAIDLWGV